MFDCDDVELVEDWNEQYPVGTGVNVEIPGGHNYAIITTVTTSKAFINPKTLEPVIMLKGIYGPHSLYRISSVELPKVLTLGGVFK